MQYHAITFSTHIRKATLEVKLVKPKLLRPFGARFPALLAHQLRVSTASFDWLNGFSVSIMIG